MRRRAYSEPGWFNCACCHTQASVRDYRGRPRKKFFQGRAIRFYCLPAMATGLYPRARLAPEAHTLRPSKEGFNSTLSMEPHVAIKRIFSSFESRLLLRRVINFPRDTFDSLTGRRDPLVPPHGLWFVGGEQDYKATNEEFIGYFIKLGQLTPDQRVLDVGCGIGIMASRLAKFLSPRGSYDGFDIVKIGIDWASRHIGSRFPNFRFVHADVFNKHYNSKGRLDPNTFTFPYETGSFDFVFLKSLFTHMRPEGVRRYFEEIRRVLKPSGRCLVTAFLLNDESETLINAGKSTLTLTHNLAGYKVLDPKFPETTVGFQQRDFQSWFAHAGLSLNPPIHFGSWCGRQQYLGYQDMLILTTSPPSPPSPLPPH